MDAIQTPQLLELSGVGDPEVIQSQGIPLVHVLKGVGNNYIDHFATRMNWRVKNTTTLNEMSRGLSLARDRKSVGEGKSVSVRVDLGGRRSIKKKNTKKNTNSI